MWLAKLNILGHNCHLFCMYGAKRLASSMRPNQVYFCSLLQAYYSALPWKCKSNLPTSKAISQTSCEKGSFLIRSLVLFWNCQISQKSNCARPVLPGLFNFSSLEKFLLGGFASHGQSELPPDWLLPWSRWPSLQQPSGPTVGISNDNGDLPTSSSHLASSTCLSASSTIFSTSLMGEGFLAGDGWCTGEGASFPSLPVFLFLPWSGAPSSPLCPFLVLV